MLKVGDGIPHAVFKYFLKERLVGNSYTSALICISDVYDVYGVREDGQAVRFK